MIINVHLVLNSIVDISGDFGHSRCRLLGQRDAEGTWLSFNAVTQKQQPV